MAEAGLRDSGQAERRRPTSRRPQRKVAAKHRSKEMGTVIAREGPPPAGGVYTSQLIARMAAPAPALPRKRKAIAYGNFSPQIVPAHAGPIRRAVTFGQCGQPLRPS